MKLLIIDDDAVIRLIAGVTLGGPGGLDVIEAADGVEGVRKARAAAPDVILLDMMMPGMDGPATLAALRSQPSTAKTPVIFMTATRVKGDPERLMALGAAGVLTKPFDPRTLLVDVRALVASWQPSPAPARAFSVSL